MFSIFIGRHFECWKRYILLAYRRRNILCSSLTLIYVTRWYSEGRPRKIRNLKYGGEIIKNRGEWNGRTRDGVFANDNAYIQFRYLAMLVDQELSNLKYYISKLELICIVARQQWIFDSRETKTFANAGHKLRY
jgi:hypothetical protein